MRPSKKERTQREILQAARAIVLSEGHEAVTVRCLAEATGYAHTNLYHYFKNLDALLWSLRLEMIESMVDDLSAASIGREDPVDELLAAFSAYAGYFFEHPNVFRFFYFHSFVQPAGDDSQEKLAQRFEDIWQASFARCVQAGLLDAADIEIVAKTIIYALQGMIMLAFSANGIANRQEIATELSKLVGYLFRHAASR